MRYTFFLIILLIGGVKDGWAGALTICDAGGRQLEPRIASDGKDFLVVWEDGRSGILDIFGRIIRGGTLLDTFAIYKGTVDNWYPRVVWNGENYLVVWSANEQIVYGQFIDKDGSLVGSTFVIAAGAFRRHLAIASNGDNHLVLWTQMKSDTCDIYATLVSKNGDSIAAPFAITTAPDSQAFPKAIAINSKNYIVVWEDRRSGNYDIYGRKLDPNGSFIDGEILVCEGAMGVNARKPSIASAGDTVIVVWEENDGWMFGYYNIWCDILDASLTLLYEDSIVSFTGEDQRDPVVTKSPTYCDKNRFLVSWHDYRDDPSKADVYYTEVNSKGSCNKDGIQITSLSGDEWKTDISAMDWYATGGFLVVWKDENNLPPTDPSNICGYIWECPLSIEETSYPKMETIYATPNPFITVVRVQWSGISEKQELRLQIYDLSGRLVKTLTPNPLSLTTAVEWDGKDEKGKKVLPGIYFAKLSDKPHCILKLIKF